MAREYIEREDLLNQGRIKLNRSIDKAYDADETSKQSLEDANRLGNEAKQISTQKGNESIAIAKENEKIAGEANLIAKDTNERMNQIIGGTTDSAEVIDSRKPVGLEPAETLGERLNLQFGNNDIFRPKSISVIEKMKEQFESEYIDVTWFGAVGNANFFDEVTKKWYEDKEFTILANDDTQAIKLACIESDSKNKDIFFPTMNFGVDIKSDKKLYEFINRNDLSLLGSGTIVDMKNYEVRELTNIFEFNNCNNISATINAKAQKIKDFETELGYLGSTMFFFKNKCNRIAVNGYGENLRYFVRSGDYKKYSEGYCSNFDINIKTDGVGYPVALYLPSDVKVNIIAHNVHRAAYFAGSTNVVGDVTVSGIVVANIAVLVTNSIINDTELPIEQHKAIGAKNINLNVKESEMYTLNSNLSLTGIGLQWVCESLFSNINFNIDMKTTDENRVNGGFLIISRASTYEPSYPNNWVDKIIFEDISVSGVIDRREQTIANSNQADIYIEAVDVRKITKETVPIFKNFSMKNLSILAKKTFQTNILRFDYNSTLLSISNFNGIESNFLVHGSDCKVEVNSSILKTIEFNERISLYSKKLSSITNIPLNKIDYYQNYDIDISKNSDNGIEILQSGLKIQWLKVYFNVEPNTDMDIKLIPFKERCLNAQVTPHGNSNINVSINGMTKDSLTVRSSVKGATLYILAVGY